MRIGIFTDCYYPQINGVVTSILNLEYMLKNLGHEVYIITAEVPDFIDKDPEHIIRLPSIPFLKWSEFRIGLFAKHTKLYNKVKSLNFDVIHTQTEFTIGLFGRQIGKDLGIPLVHTYHTVHEEYTHYISKFGQEPLKKVVRSLSKKYLRRFHAVIVPTMKTKKLLESYNIKNKIYIVPTGIDIDKFRFSSNDAEINQIKKSLNLSENSFKLIFLGRISQEKNIDLLINSMPKILEKNKNIELIIAGDGPSKNEIERLSENLGIRNKVFFTNRVPNEKVSTYYKCADLFISPSKTETQGLTIFEAMAAGIPVLVYNDSNIEEVIINKYNGLLFENEEELISQIDFAVNNPEELKKYAEAAAVTADTYSSHSFAAKIEEIYKELLK